ncbi:unnamed protein product [Cuscuta europaea]|uniref:Uncharacterized protein n=1 Tax=Cuscuta europaea TaxID=41803 RepID=A0A9P1ENH2_CUSEU|nr:unnamed protein product [Cuscuta europaea]
MDGFCIFPFGKWCAASRMKTSISLECRSGAILGLMAASYKHPGSSRPRAAVVLVKEQFSLPSKNPSPVLDGPLASQVIILSANIPGSARKYLSGFRNPLVNIWPHLSFLVASFVRLQPFV